MSDTADTPRVMVRYAGVQVEDARDRIRIVFIDPPVRGVRSALRYVGKFEPQGSERVWQRFMSPDAIFKAAHILGEFYGEELKS